MTNEELTAILAAHIVWVETEGRNGMRADLEGANLEGANLRGANLGGANLGGANLVDAGLKDANLVGANLIDADLEGANLVGANLYGANLQGADLYGANLGGAKLEGADLYRANLYRANLYRANLEGANLEGANLGGANLEDANLYGANLYGANLVRANLIDADLKDANLVSANLMDANLRGAKLAGAVLALANLARADLEGADLEGADLERADLEGAIGLVLPELKPKTALGRKAGVLGKLKKQALPMKAGAFKKLFPDEFEKIKADTQGADFTPKLLESLVAKHGFTWGVVAGRYTSSAQRICANANDVLMLVIDISDDAYTDEQRKQLRAVAQVSSRSGHPVAAGSNLFTVGWIRYCVFPDRILIEEVQSDVGGVRKGLKDSEFSESLLGSGINPEELDATMALVQPFADRFYEDAVALVFDMAAEQGKNVEMLDYKQKEPFGSPRNVYTDLPKSMGMKLGPSEAMPELGQVWTYTPNRRTRRR